jgi:hypothetical protein
MIAPDAGRGEAAALFDPAEARVEINTKAAFGALVRPQDVGDFSLRKQQFKYPQAAGALLHESFHARHTTFDLMTVYKAIGAEAMDAFMLLEESRIEYWGLLRLPENRAFLRSCIMNMVMQDTKDPKYKKLSHVRQAVRTMALTRARVDAGTLKEKNIKHVRKELNDVLPDELQEKFRDLWLEFQGYGDPSRDGCTERMQEIAIEWVRLCEETADARGEKKREVIFVHFPGMPPDAPDEDGEEMEDDGESPIMIAVYDDAPNTEIEARGEVHDQEDKEISEAEAEARQKAAEERENHRKVGFKVFNYKDSSDGHSNSRIKQSRPPTTEDRIAAVIVSKQLDKARYRDRIKTTTHNVTPPGRTKTRAIVQGAAYRAVGVNVETEPFRRTRYQHVDDPNLTVGIMVDKSGSMSGAMAPMGATAWVFSEAVHRIQGKAAMVYYGSDVFPSLRPGERQQTVNIYSAPDGSHDFDKAFQALDGTLDLLTGTGARLLVVVSDGQYGSHESERTRHWLDRCYARGVAVLWLGFGYTEGGDAAAHCAPTGAEYIVPDADKVTDAALAIGVAAAKALTRAGATR